MAEIAGPAWTSEYELAWSEAYGVLAAAMIRGAQEATPVAA
jgi:hemoglobin-like flavoprotein